MASAQTLERGKLAYTTHCAACHLDSGHGNQSIHAPPIAGLERWHIARELRRYQWGIRGRHPDDKQGQLMRQVVMRLSDADISFISRYTSRLDPISNRVTVAEAIAVEDQALDNERTGAQIYMQICQGCHARDGSGNRQLNAPGLTIQSDWALTRSLEAYRSGKRAYLESDNEGIMMKAISQALSKEDIGKVVRYIASRKVETESSSKMGDSSSATRNESYPEGGPRRPP